MMQSKSGKVNYALPQSPFYRIKSLHFLAQLLKVGALQLKKDSPLFGKYIHGSTLKSDGSERATQTPYGTLRRVHERTLILFQRVATPAYLHSGIKGRSYISNARSHANFEESFCLDIAKFFPSTTRSHVYGFFRDTMKCSADISAICSNLYTVDGHLPTGSPLSTLISYFVHVEMFDELWRLSARNNVLMTVYVDDVVFSGLSVSKSFREEAIGIIRRRGLKSHKYRIYRSFEPREVTGVIVDRERFAVPQRRHQALYEGYVDLWNSEGTEERGGAYRRVLSRLSEGAQIENRLKVRKRSLMGARLNIFASNR